MPDPYYSVVDYDREEARSAAALEVGSRRWIGGQVHDEADVPDEADL